MSDDAHNERDEATEREKNFTRRALLQAGVAAPIAYALARRLPGARPHLHSAQTHTDTPHQDTAHADTSHGDQAHTDTPHDDHGDCPPPGPDCLPHGDSAHSDTAHVDTAHVDSAHADIPHGDSTTHADAPHADHTDVPSAPAAGAVTARPRFTG